MEQFLLGIDIGTSACKAALFTLGGRVVAQSFESYAVYRPQPGWAEQNPDEWLDASFRAIKNTIAIGGIDPRAIVGVGIDGQGWSAVAIDSDGNTLGNTPIWFDTRANEICGDIKRDIGEDEIFQLCGNPLSPSYTLPKVLWTKKHLPELYRRTDKILQSNSYIAYRLTNELSQDISQCYAYQCFNMRKGIFDRSMATAMGFDLSLVPQVFMSHEVIGYVTRYAAEETGLCEGTPVVAGGLDAACATLGAGVINPGETQEQGGQAGGMSICLDTYRSDPRLILGFHVVPEKWLLQGGTVGGGGALKWLRETMFPEMSFAEMSELAETVPPGADGLVFLPYMSGERSPIWNPSAKGVFYGLDYGKSRAHIIRAVMEGTAFSLRHNLETAEEAGATVSTLNAMGGAANSLVWTQIKSDVTAKEIVVPSSDTATTLGAAILAGVGVGVWNNFGEALKETLKINRKHQPNPETADVYSKQFAIYRETYENLKTLMDGE